MTDRRDDDETRRTKIMEVVTDFVDRRTRGESVNQADVVRFFIEQKTMDGGAAIDLNPRDCWGGTPLDDGLILCRGQMQRRAHVVVGAAQLRTA